LKRKRVDKEKGKEAMANADGDFACMEGRAATDNLRGDL